MKDLVRIGLIRLYKNWVYLFGCVLAVAITTWFLQVRPIPQLTHYSAENVAILLSGAIVLFFSFFVGYFIGNEYEDGILRNKVMAGHSQITVYLSHYITLVIAMTVMLACWFVGAMLGGTKISGRLFVYCFVALLYNAAYIAIIQAMVFRLKKQVIGITLSIGFCYFLVTNVLIGNFLFYLVSEQTVLSKVIMIVYNMSALGQCFAKTEMADPGIGATGVQVAVSLVLIAAASFLGTLRLAKRDIK